MLLGAIEAGGTKFVCAVSDLELNIVERISLPTTTPEETLNAVYTFFDNYTLDALAIGSFGPIDVNKNHQLTVISHQHPKQPGKTLIC